MKKILLALFIITSIGLGVYLLFHFARPVGEIITAPASDDLHAKIDISESAGIDVSGLARFFGSWLNTSQNISMQDDNNGVENNDVHDANNLEDQEVPADAVFEDVDPDVFVDVFTDDRILEETRTQEESSHVSWWLSSGGFMTTKDGVGKTIHGALVSSDKWFQLYADGPGAALSDNGLHPQNVFRLVQRGQWLNYDQHVFFRIDRHIESDAVDRGPQNGFFLFNRYQDQDNLYAVGFRVDGKVVIKKKLDGIYTTLFESQLIEGEYDVQQNPLLLPLGEWIGIRSVVEDLGGGQVNIKAYADIGRTGNWSLVGSTVDDESISATNNLSVPGHAGLRSDFMDVSFDEYSIRKL